MLFVLRRGEGKTCRKHAFDFDLISKIDARYAGKLAGGFDAALEGKTDLNQRSQ
jgi:hypothetical protein